MKYALEGVLILALFVTAVIWDTVTAIDVSPSRVVQLWMTVALYAVVWAVRLTIKAFRVVARTLKPQLRGEPIKQVKDDGGNVPMTGDDLALDAPCSLCGGHVQVPDYGPEDDVVLVKCLSPECGSTDMRLNPDGGLAAYRRGTAAARAYGYKISSPARTPKEAVQNLTNIIAAGDLQRLGVPPGPPPHPPQPRRGAKIMRQVLAMPFKVAGIIAAIGLGLWAFIMQIGIVNDVVGFWGVVIGVAIFPVTFAAAPWYAGVAQGNWFPLILGYGGPFAGMLLYQLGSLIAGEPLE